MRRLLLGIVLGGFLTLIGVQAAHTHKTVKTSEPCAVCALAQQASRHSPKAAPTISVPYSAQDVVLPHVPASRPRLAADARARAPPAAV